MEKIIGGLISPHKIDKISNVNVSWSWYDKDKGVVKWTFVNNASIQQSGLLFRVMYPFGNAFWPIYVDNPDFGTRFTTIVSSLYNEGVENNSPPLAVYKNPNGTMFVAFLFTLSPHHEYSMLEGGFSDTLMPDTAGSPQFIPCEKDSVSQFNILWDTNQCSGYNSQAGTNLPCPKEPISVSSALMNLTDNVIPLFDDIITQQSGKTSCLDTIIDGIDTFNAAQVIAGLECAFGTLSSDYAKKIKKRIR